MLKKYKISICVCSRKYNKYLLGTLKSISKNILKKFVEIHILIIFNNHKKITKYEKKIIQKILYKKKYNILYEKKLGIANVRNAYLNFLEKKNFDFCSFLDDDCLINKNFFLNHLKFILYKKCQIVTGPQIYLSKRKFFKVFERYFKKGTKLRWASTNNVFFKRNIINKKTKFSNKVTKYGYGEDQLFFSQLAMKNNKILWNNNPVYEVIQKDRENLSWFLKRSVGYGLTGYLIDKELYGNFKGFFLNFFKIFFYIFLIIKNSFNIFFNPIKNYYEIIYNLLRVYGRIISFKNIIR